MRFAGRDVALTRALALQGLEEAVQRGLTEFSSRPSVLLASTME
jgi:hypothetical protein